MPDESEKIERLAAEVLQKMRELSVDYQVKYEREYRRENPGDDEELVRVFVDRKLGQLEAKFLIDSMSAVVTSDITSSIPGAYFRVMRIVKTERATPIRRNKWNQVKRKSHATLKAEQEKLRRAASLRLRRESDQEEREKAKHEAEMAEKRQMVLPVREEPPPRKDDSISAPPPSQRARHVQTFMGSILDEVERQSRT